MAGTGLSSHEINQPGCYKNVKDTSITAQFKINKTPVSFWECDEDIYLLLGQPLLGHCLQIRLLLLKKVLCFVRTVNQYTKKPIVVVLAENFLIQFFPVNMFL